MKRYVVDLEVPDSVTADDVQGAMDTACEELGGTALVMRGEDDDE